VPSVEVFEQQRGRLFGIAYRMLGSASEAEDIVQDAWLRWQGSDTAAVREPAAFLATIVTRLSLTALDSARSRREVYVGPWLPEPVSTQNDPELLAEHAESLNLAVLLLLERLSGPERAAYVLHEAFDYPFRQIAEVLETSEANARQLASRARAHLDRERGVTVTAAERDRLLAAFMAAARSGDLEALEAALTEDAVSMSDGGGVVSAARKPIAGRDRIARLVLGLFEKYPIEIVPVEANGEPAMLGLLDGEPLVVISLDIAPGGVRQLLAVVNPSKLERFAAAVLSRS
jgi:RNA polymerase sigma-70 factor (ECF subfamily)